MIIPVVLSGGVGSRLWPLSRELCPKQLLPLVEECSMLQSTVARLEGIPGIGDPMLICNESHRFIVAEQVRQVGVTPSAIVLEPVGRNTAPAAAIAALQAMAKGEDPLLLVLPADHVIQNKSAFHDAVEIGRILAEKGKLITFGIVPAHPETGYGYIRAGGRLEVMCDEKGVMSNLKGTSSAPSDEKGFAQHRSQITPYAVDAFFEKPDLITAEGYVASGDYYWNSGMFLFRASSYLAELERFAPEMAAGCRRAHDGMVGDLDFLRLSVEDFASCPADSIDYAVMEKTVEAAVIPLDVGWSDVGSWAAMWEVGERNGDGNVTRGDVVAVDAKNCYLHASDRMIAVVGLEDHVVVETSDVVLVAHRDRVQDVKKIVEELKRKGRGEAVLHRRVTRPWGAYESIDSAERFQVKHITVLPGASLSLQRHHHRAEHWVVVKGTAQVVRGEETSILSENQSTYIPLGVKHRLENPGKILLEIIEIQSGSYLGEDDIERFEDNYGRQ